MNLKRSIATGLAVAVLVLGAAIAQNITKSVQLSQDPSGAIGFSTGGSVWFPTYVHTNQAATPTLGNCGSGAITGTGLAGEVEEGSGSVTTCSVTFPVAYNATPYCTAIGDSTTTPVAMRATPNGFLLTHIASAAKLRWTYSCWGPRAGQT